MKLIRDKYVDCIKPENLRKSTDYEEKLGFILDKIKEELIEYLDSKCRDPMELADVMQAVIDLGNLHGHSFDLVNKLRKEKEEKLGGFKDFIILKNMTPNLNYTLSSDTEEHF